MANLKRPGQYIEEVLDPIDIDPGVSDSVAVFLGAHYRGPSALALCTSWSQFATKFGGFPTDGSATDFPHAVFQFFAGGGGQCYAGRVVHTDAITATATLVDSDDVDTLRIDAKDDGAWGNDLAVTITNVVADTFDLLVYYLGTTDAYIVERWEALTMDDAASRHVEKVINSATQGSNFIVATDLDSVTAAPGDTPVAIATEALATGTDGTAVGTTQYTAAVTEGTSPMDIIDGRVDVNIPGITTAAVITAASAYVEARESKGFVVVDSVLGNTPAQAVTYRDTLTDTAYAALYYPRTWVEDPTSNVPGALRLVPSGALALGMIHRTDTNRGVFKAPAGEVDGRIPAARKMEVSLSKADRDLLNINNVNAIHVVPRKGICCMGSRTLKTGRADRYVNVRRSLNYIEDGLLRATSFAVQENNDELLWDRIHTAADRFLGEYHEQGGLRGATPGQAYYVVCDGDLNTEQEIEQGKVIYEVGVALQYPAEYVILRIGQWSGGSAVSETA